MPAVRQHFPCSDDRRRVYSHPNVTEAQSGDSLGFHFKWNLGWMHDVLEFLNVLSLSVLNAFRNYYIAVNIITSGELLQVFSHDEVVHEKRSFAFEDGCRR